jgi:hypothetical protein
MVIVIAALARQDFPISNAGVSYGSNMVLVNVSLGRMSSPVSISLFSLINMQWNSCILTIDVMFCVVIFMYRELDSTLGSLYNDLIPQRLGLLPSSTT